MIGDGEIELCTSALEQIVVSRRQSRSLRCAKLSSVSPRVCGQESFAGGIGLNGLAHYSS
eukprot:6488094-Amphidinium_carterae.1